IISLELGPERTFTILQWNILFPAASVIICILAILSCVYMLTKKRSPPEFKSNETAGIKSLMELENQRNDNQCHAYSPSPSRKVESKANENGSDYEICPYATLNLQTMAHSMQFETFSQRDCYSGQPTAGGAHYSSRPARFKDKLSMSASPNDGLDSEISCISSQQTLPVKKKRVSKDEARTRFNCHYESSSCDKPLPHYTPSHLSRNADSSVFDLDSSTESAEASPEVKRSKRGASSRIQPPTEFSDNREVSDVECDRDRDNLRLQLLNHSKFEKQLYSRLRRELTRPAKYLLARSSGTDKMQTELLLMLLSTAIGIMSQGPVFVQEPQQWVELSNASGALLACSAHGSPPPDIRWLDADDRELTHMSYLREVLHNGSLYFPPFSAENFRPDVHATTYRCLASNPSGSIISRDANLKPDVHSSGALIVDDVTATKGNVAILRCNAAASAQRSLSWLRDDPLLGRSALHSGGKYVTTAAGTLHMRDVSRDDTYARFYCQTIDKVTGEPRISKPARVAVLEPDTNSAPRITYSSSEIRKQIGSQAELECVGEAYPPPKYRWYKQEGGMLMEVQAQSMFVKPLDSVLHFQQLRPEDGGVYVCVVNNVLGEDRQDLLLITSAPLSVYIHPQYQVVDGGSRAVFNCSVHGGEGIVSIVWMKDARPLHEGGRISLQQQNEILIIEGVSKIDRGMYQCYVRSGEETAQGTSQLTLGAIPPTLLTTFVEQTIQPGVTVSLRCIAAGNPPPRVTWLLDGGALLPRGQYMLGSFVDAAGDVISHLNITNARVQHGGIYTCVAKNSLGSVQHSEPLNIYGPPSARGPLNLTAVSGGETRLQCPVAGYPVVSTTWQHAGVPLPANYRQRVFANGTLLIAQLKNDADRGHYTCTVRNQQGQSASSKLHLDIKRPPKIAPFHFPANMEEGDRAQISCTVISGDLPIEIMWQKDGRPLSQDPDIQEQANQFVNNLQFLRLSGRHAGHYTCIVKNSAAEVNHTAELVIKVPPSWVIEPEDISVLVHHPVFFHCKATGFPQPRVSWMKSTGDAGNEYLPLELTSGAIIYGNGTVYIPSPSAAHESVYSCQASNGIGPVLKKDIFLTINVPAHFTSRSLNQSIVLGSDVSLTCEAEGDLPLRVTWGSGPAKLPPPQTRHTSTGLVSEIHLHSFSRRYAGAYHCTAHNDFGHDTMVIYLAVKEPPLAPSNVEVVEVGSRWLSVRWTAADSAPVTQYLVQFQEEGAATGAWANITVSGSTHAAHLSALAPATAYAVRVVAINDVGAGPPSHVIDAVTLQEAPSEPPEDVTAESPAPRTLVIRWKPPSRGKLRSSILGYKISYREIAKGTPSVRTVRGHQRTEITLTSLQQFSRYEITVTAFNRVGSGPPSTPFIATTVEGGYKLSYHKQPSGEWREIQIEADQQIYTLNRLHCGSAYELYIQARNAVGQSKPSPALQAFTKGHMPNPPDLDDLLSVNSTSAIIYLESWPAGSGGCPVLYFSVAYRRAHTDAQWRSPGVELSPLHDVTLNDLTPSTAYTLRVAVTTEAGTHQKEYIFVTRSKSGEIVPLELIPEQRSSVLEDMNIVLPVMTGIICSITLTVVSWRMYHKRRTHQKNPIEDCRSKSLMEMDHQSPSSHQGHTFSPTSPRKIDSSISANKGSDTSGTEYEIYPYATFNLPSQPMGHSMQFQTFNQRDCYEGRPVKEYHRARMHKPSTSASPPDGLSLEISCITSQQTLPVARRKGGTKEKKKGSTSFICDSDSSSEKRHIYTQHTPVHPPRNTGEEYSVEDIKMESNTTPEAPNSDTNSDLKYDESKLLALEEKIRASENFSRELRLKMRSDLEAGSSSSDDDESENSDEGELLDQIFEERVALTDIIGGESKPQNSDTNSVQVYDESKLLALNEKIRASKNISRKLRLKTRSDLESGSYSSSASDDDESRNSFEEGSLSQNFGELEVQATLTKKISEECNPEKTIEIIDFEANLSTESISCGEEPKVFQEQTVHAKKNPEVEQIPKYSKNLKPRANLDDLMIEKCLKGKSKKTALYIESGKELTKITENIDLNSNESILSRNKSQQSKYFKTLKPRAHLHNLLIEKCSKEKSALCIESEKELTKITENIDLNSNVSILSRNKSQNVSEKKQFKELFNCVQNIPENIDLKPKVDDNQDTSSEIERHRILFEKNLRNVNKLGRECKLLKERENTYQSVELAEELEMLKGNSDLCKLFIDNKSLSAEEPLEDRVNKAKEVNANKQAFLLEWKIRIEEALQENLKLQKMIPEHEPKKKGKKWTDYTAAVFGMPYFKDKDRKFSCPPNAETRLRIETGHPLNPARDSGKWTKKEISKLKSSVEEILRDKLLSNLSAQVNEIKESNVLESATDTSTSVNPNMSSSSVAESSPPLVNKRKWRVKTSKIRATSKSTNRQPSKSCNPKKNASHLRSLDVLNDKISQVRAMSLIELMSEANIDDDCDWKIISTNTFSLSRSASECQGYFKMILDPTLNHEGWTKQENDKLVLLADKYSGQDWDAIATELGTNRSAYQCCSHFERNFDKNIRVIGKWSKEEDDKLIYAVKTFRAGNQIPWEKISYFMATRSVQQIRSHWTETLAPHLKKGRFSPEEDELLLRAVEKYGLSFRSAAALFPNRTAVQIKGRYIRKMENAKTKGRWSLEEDKTLLKLVDEIGVGKWKKISEHFTTRTRTQVRQSYNYIKSLMDKYPDLEVEEIYRRAASKKSVKQTDEETPENAAVACNTKSLVAPSETDKNITCEAEVSKDVPNTMKTRRKSKIFVDVITPTESAAVASNSKSLVAPSEADLKISESKDAPNTRKTRKRKSEVSVDAIMPPPKQMKTSGAINKDQRRYDNILKSINQKSSKRKTQAGIKLMNYFQEAYPMQAIVGKKTWDDTDISNQAKLMFDLSHILRVDYSYVDDPSRQRAVRPFMLKKIVNRMLENHGDELLRLNPVTSDHHSNEDRRPECDVAESDTSHIDYVPVPVEETLCADPFPGDFDDDSDRTLFSPKRDDEEAEREKQRHLKLVQEKKKEFMEFSYLVPPNVATAVGYRSLLLVERKLKDPNANQGQGSDAPPPPPPDYTPSEFRMKDAAAVAASDAHLHNQCVRFTKEEAIHMFQERLKALFAGPIVMGECSDRYFNVNNLPIYKSVPLSKNKRKTTADRYRELQLKKLASAADKHPQQDIQIEVEPTETPYSMPSLENCDAGPSTSFHDSQPSTSCSVNPSTSSSSSLGESNSSTVNKQKCPVKPKISATKTLDFCQPSTSKSAGCRVRSVKPSTSSSSSEPAEQRELSKD
ncbi:hypothetical protein LSTR_LSTR007221, partial [Laodelphax striatellus]